MDGLRDLAEILELSEQEKNEMFDLAGRDRNQVSPDLPEYIMDKDIPAARVALRKARNAGLGDDFWKEINTLIDNRS
jgi:hypothetical protein